MTEYLIKVAGCDDTTRVVAVLDPAELAPIQRVAELVNRHGGGCRPEMTVVPLAEVDEFDLENAEREVEA